MTDRISAEIFSARFTLHKADTVTRTFKGMASVFGAPIDAHPPTVVQKGAFTRTLAEQGDRVKILWQHDPAEPIGRPVSLRETDEGLEIVGRLDPIPLGERALTQIKSGTLTDMSIGFDAISWDFVKDVRGGEPIRMLKEVKLWEVSIVTWGAQRLARLTAHSRRLNAEREQAMRVLDQAADDLRRQRLVDLMEGSLHLMGGGR